MSGRYRCYSAALGGLIGALLLTTSVATQSIAQPENSDANRQQVRSTYADRKTGALLTCSQAAGAAGDAYHCQTARKPSIRDRVWRWVFRAGRDPIAIFTFALLTVGVWQVGVAHRTAHRQLRAYLHLTPGWVEEQNADTGFKFEARPNLINKGQTPAYDVRYQATLRPLPGQLPKGFDFSTHHETSATSATLGPDQTSFLVCTAEGLLSVNEIAQVKGAGPLFLRLYGTVSYRDAFKKRHFTNFNWILVWSGQGLRWMMQREHQEAD